MTSGRRQQQQQIEVHKKRWFVRLLVGNILFIKIDFDLHFTTANSIRLHMVK